MIVLIKSGGKKQKVICTYFYVYDGGHSTYQVYWLVNHMLAMCFCTYKIIANNFIIFPAHWAVKMNWVFFSVFSYKYKYIFVMGEEIMVTKVKKQLIIKYLEFNERVFIGSIRIKHIFFLYWLIAQLRGVHITIHTVFQHFFSSWMSSVVACTLKLIC